MQYGIRDDSGTLIAGITAVLYCWRILYTDALWVDERHRHRGLGTTLVRSLEGEAQTRGGTLSHLDTFDFQGKSFYEKLGRALSGLSLSARRRESACCADTMPNLHVRKCLGNGVPR